MSSLLRVSVVLPIIRSASAPHLGEDRYRLEQETIALFDQFRNPLLRYLATFGLAVPDAEEIVQETFLSLFQHLRRGKSGHNLAGWLFRVAHNLALKRRLTTRRDLEKYTRVAIENLTIDPDPNPEDQVLNTQAQQRLQAIVQALSEQDRRCLTLRAEGLRYREIAEILDMSLGAVCISLTRSLARFARSAER